MYMARCAEIIGGGSLDGPVEAQNNDDPDNKSRNKPKEDMSLHRKQFREVKIGKKPKDRHGIKMLYGCKSV